MKTTKGRPHGVIVPAITLVNRTDGVDKAAFGKLLRRLVKAGVSGIFVGASVDDRPLLTDAEWRRMVLFSTEA